MNHPPRILRSARMLLAFCGVMLTSGTAVAAPEATLPAQHSGFFRNHCLACHSAEKSEGNVRLDDLSFTIESIEAAERWQKVLGVLNSGEMPPADRPKPDANAKADLLADLSQAMVAARKTLGDQGSVAALRRLNRREYANTIRDLFGIDPDVSALPDDKGGAEFDTIGSSLFMSSDQFEQYLAVGRKAATDALELWRRTAAGEPPRASQHVESELAARRAVSGPVYMFVIKSYKEAKRWQSAGADPARAKEFGVADDVDAKFKIDQVERKGTLGIVQWFSKPRADDGAWLLTGFYNAETIEIPAKAPIGDYVLRLKIGADPAPEIAPERRFLEMGIVEGSDFKRLRAFQITAPVKTPETLEIPISITSDGPRKFSFRERRYSADEAENHRSKLAIADNGVGIDPALWIDWQEWEGPIPDSSAAGRWLAVFGSPYAADGDPEAARRMLEHFATRAFRGVKPKPAYIDRLAAMHAAKRAAGKSFPEALIEPMAVVLASPAFLYLNEPVAAEKSERSADRRLSDLELASRLSYFLWAGPPDEALLKEARAGTLRTPDHLASQTTRMLADPRSLAFARGFTRQWLDVDRLDFFRFDFQLHPDFDETAQAASKDEICHTFHTLLTENLDARNLLKSDFVVVNGLLALYYGLEDTSDPAKPKPITGDQFRKVSLPPGSPRGGLLGMAAVLGMGGNGERTSPVERGAWVLRKLLNDPPPPAPANVPQLSRLDGKPVDTRERLRMHQEQPQCAQCHRRIDPIGFGLENFDAAGKWRTEEWLYRVDFNPKAGLFVKNVAQSFPIEPAGAFHEGPSFKDFYELRERVAARGDDFLRGLVERLYAYALGRPVSFFDTEAIDAIVEAAKARYGRLADIVQLIVASPEFQTK